AKTNEVLRSIYNLPWAAPTRISSLSDSLQVFLTPSYPLIQLPRSTWGIGSLAPDFNILEGLLAAAGPLCYEDSMAASQPDGHEVTTLLDKLSGGNSAAADALAPLIYPMLHRMAANC